MRKLKKLGSMVLMVIMIACMQTGVFAAGNEDLMPPLENRKVSLELDCIYHDDKESDPVEGLEFSIYKVADLKVTDGSVEYIPAQEYEDLGLSFEGMTASQSNEAAVKIRKEIEKKGITGKAGVTDSKGQVYFGDLDPGMYVVIQTGARGEAEKYHVLDPFLMMVPGINNGAWVYDMKAEPKPSLQKDEPAPPAPKPVPPVKTGDDMDLVKYFFMAVLSLILILIATSVILISGKKRKSKDKKK